MTGERDLRTPMEQTEQYYRALKLRKVPTAMIRLTDGWHSRSSPPTNFLRVQLYLRRWFERFLVGAGVAGLPPGFRSTCGGGSRGSWSGEPPPPTRRGSDDSTAAGAPQRPGLVGARKRRDGG